MNCRTFYPNPRMRGESHHKVFFCFSNLNLLDVRCAESSTAKRERFGLSLGQRTSVRSKWSSQKIWRAHYTTWVQLDTQCRCKVTLLFVTRGWLRIADEACSRGIYHGTSSSTLKKKKKILFQPHWVTARCIWFVKPREVNLRWGYCGRRN